MANEVLHYSRQDEKKQRSESVMEKEQRLHAYGYHPEIKFKLPVDNKIEPHT